MKNKLLYCLLIVFALFSLLFFSNKFGKNTYTKKENDQNNGNAEENKEFTKVDFERFFQGLDGCAIFYSIENDRHDVYNSDMINVLEIPCSTFKIVSSLAGLKYNVIENENSVIKWDRSKQRLKEWEQDLDLKTALKVSANWYFEKIDNQVGTENMKEILKEINYGNLDISGGMPLGESGLKISPMEQLDLVRKLFNNNLPFTEKHMEIVRNAMFIDNEKGQLYGKTGTSGTSFLENGAQTAWFIGDYKTEKDEFYFALRIYGDKNNKNILGGTAQKIAKDICQEIYYK